MVPRIHAGGKSFSGVVAYLTHDSRTPDERHPKTSERVGFVELENLPECEASTAARIMAGTAREADTLKELAGVSSRGRKLDKPVYHFSLSWAPGERPDRDGMLDAARSSLKSLGMDDRQAVIVEHTDRKHRHVHVVVNRVSAEDGRAASRSHDARKLSRWAHTWERENDGVRCHRRQRQALERVLKNIKRTFKRDPAPEPPPARPRRCPGRRDRAAEERRGWAKLYASHRAETAREPASHRAERRELSRQHRQERATPPKETVSEELHHRRTHFSPDNQVVRAAMQAESRLPSVAHPTDPSKRVLAVSDETLNRCSDFTGDDQFVSQTMAFLRARHRHDVQERAQAEREYHREAIEEERVEWRERHKSRWRAGTVESPEQDPQDDENAAKRALLPVAYGKIRRVFDASCRSILDSDRHHARLERERKQAREQSHGRDDDHGLEH